MRRFLVFCGLGLCLSPGVSLAQVSANALHNRYPAPLREEIEVRPGISMTVRYGTGLIACEIRIDPTTTSLLLKEPETLIHPEIVTEILEEIVPERERGRAGVSLIELSGCIEQDIYQYEFVEIARSRRGCLPLQVARESSAMVTFKWPECAALQTARQQPPAK